MYRNILIDMDMTIFDFRKTEEIALRRLAEKYGFELNDEARERYKIGNQQCWQEFEKGLIDLDQLKDRRMMLFFEKMGIDENYHTAGRFFTEELSGYGILMDGADEFLRTLKRRGYRLYIITNGIALTQHGRIHNSGTEDLWDGVYISEEMNTKKPDREFFDIMFRDSGIKREESVVFGDSLTSDIMGGINAGVDTIWLNQHDKECGDIIPTYTCRNYDEVLSILSHQE